MPARRDDQRGDTAVTPFGGKKGRSFDTNETVVRDPHASERPEPLQAPVVYTPPPRPAARPTPQPASSSRPPSRPSSSTRIPKAPPAEPFEAPMPTAKGKVIVVFGCRGGAGATTLSVNVAASLARTGKNVCVLDLDLQLGDVNVALDLEPNTSISAIAREASTMDGAALKRRLQRHDSGVYALSQTGRLDDVDPELPERMPALLAMLCDHFDVVVVDGVRDFGDHALAALDMADQVALVLTQDVPAVRRAARVVQLFRRLGYSDSKLQLVLNRHSGKATVAESEIERVLQLPISMRVRNDFARMDKALNEGSLLHDIARGAGVARDIENLAAVLSGEKVRRIAQPAEKKGLFARIFGKDD